MRKLLLSLFAVLALAVQAQTTMHIHTKDGVLKVGVSEIDSIFFVNEKKGTPENPYTVAELLKACEGLEANAFLNDGAEVCARGVVKRVKEFNTQYGNITYYISDALQSDESFYVYRGYLLNRGRVSTGEELQMGDTVVVCGKVKYYQGKTLEFDSGNYQLEHRVKLPSEEEKNAHLRLEFPMSKEGDNNRLVVHMAKLNDVTGEWGVNYSTEWDKNIRAQRWSCYQMYASLLQKNASRYSGGYPNDYFLPFDCQFEKDPYVSSGYDHGHICPSADRQGSTESNVQTFFMSNMQPQAHAFNAGLWGKMEDQVRAWVSKFDTLYVCKGGTIDRADQISTYVGGEGNQIPVPKYFFVAVLGKNDSGYTAIGLWAEHRTDYGSNAKVGDYVVNIRELEQLTGIDFFHNLPDEVEESVETLPVSNLINVWGL